MLKEYQLARFIAFADPSSDPQGIGYNVNQARIAIGNGGVFGQGLFHGSQTQNAFVPEQHTDFVFTVAGEELGLIGAGAIIVLFAVILFRGLRIAINARDAFGRLVATGIVCWFAFQAFENIGMTLGHHAGHRPAAAVRLVRRFVDVRRPAGRRPVAEHPPALPPLLTSLPRQS